MMKNKNLEISWRCCIYATQFEFVIYELVFLYLVLQSISLV